MTRIILVAATVALSFLTLTTDAAVVTVFGVQAPRTTQSVDPTDTISYIKPSVEWAGTETASAIGPGESGRTRYEVKNIQSRFVIHRSGVEPKTIISEPMTATYTHEQGGNILIEKGDPTISTFAAGGTIEEVGLNMECILDDQQKWGVCAGEHLHAVLTEVVSGTQTLLATVTETVATTYTGSVFPIATLTTNGGAGSLASRRSTVALIAAVVLGGVFSL